MITSFSNQKVKNVTALLSSAKTRREQSSYVIEGFHLFGEAPTQEIRQVFLTEKALVKITAEGYSLIDEHLVRRGDEEHPIAYETVSSEVFQKMSDTKTPQGVLCVMQMPNRNLSEALGGITPTDELLALVLEGIQDPGNLGTMLRSGEAAGVSFILADKKTADLYNPKVIRATMGAIFRVPVIYTEDLPKGLQQLKAAGVKLCAAHLKGANNHWDESYPLRCGFLIGNEGNGLSDDISEMADILVKIPMQGKVESLNAAVAASLLLYEYARKRS